MAGSSILDLSNIRDNNQDFLSNVKITSLQLADINSDTNRDIIVGSNIGIIIFTNTTKNDPFSVSIGSYFLTRSLEEVNQVIAVDQVDGRTDLVSCNNDGIFVMKNSFDGTGNFSPHIKISNLRTQNIIAGDFNGDGINDIAAIQDGKILVLNGTIDGTYTQFSSVPTENRCNSMAVGDFDKDGKTDLVLQTSDSTEVYVYSERSNGIELVAKMNSFYLASQLYNNGSNAVAREYRYYNGLVGSLERSEIAVADFNTDGNLDIAVSGPNGIMLGLGNFIFTDHGQSLQSKNHLEKANRSPNWPSPSTDTFRSIGVGDINNDGIPDLLTNINNQVMVDYSSTEYVLSSPQFIGNTETNGINCFLSIGDINSDGKLDFLTTGGIEYTDSVEFTNSNIPKDLAFVQFGDTNSVSTSYPIFSNKSNKTSERIEQSLPSKEFTLTEGLIVDFYKNPNLSSFITIRNNAILSAPLNDAFTIRLFPVILL